MPPRRFSLCVLLQSMELQAFLTDIPFSTNKIRRTSFRISSNLEAIGA